MTTHIALYRKYRPTSFDDVVGQETIVTLLESSIAKNAISHAYLFCGGRGTGKTTVARIFARAIGCNDEDIIEIDAASNRGIDEIRELREAVRTAPFSSPYKIYIIDEAHMLTKEASNALLKTLEEPPAHVVFILATTDPEKLPTTIVSRCQKIVFKTPDLLTLSNRLIHVAKKEGKELEEDVALLIAKHGKGSYRDALGYLEQAINSSQEKKLSLSHITLALGQPEKVLLTGLLTAFCERNTKDVLTTLSELQKKGNALRTYDELLEMVRHALMARFDVWGEDEEIVAFGKKYPTIINSRLVLSLLENRHYITISPLHEWLAVQAILLEELTKTS